MKIIYRPRCTGKTTELIEMALAENLYIICANHKECINISRQSQMMEKFIPFPLTYDEFINKRFCGRNINGFLIDNVEILLQYMAGIVPVKAMAFRNAAFAYLNACDNGEVCSDRSCLRCRIADAAFEVEQKHGIPPMPSNTKLASLPGEADCLETK